MRLNNRHCELPRNLIHHLAPVAGWYTQCEPILPPTECVSDVRGDMTLFRRREIGEELFANLDLPIGKRDIARSFEGNQART